MNYPAPQQYPGFPPQQPQAPMQPQYPGYPQQVQQPAYAPPQQQYPQPAYQQPQAPAQPPAPPLASGTLDDFYNQPSAGGGPSISWKDKPIGTYYAGVVARDVTKADIQQQTDPQTKQPKFYRDGRPQFVMKVPLLVNKSEAFPEGEATLFVRGQMKDELVRAMAEAGVTGAPTKGATIVVQLAGKRNTGAIPANQFAIQYAPEGQAAAPQPPVQQAPVQQYEQQPQQQFQAPPQAVQPQFQPPVQQVPVPQQQFAQQAPAQAAAPQPPADMTADQQALLARLTGQQQTLPQAG